MIHAKKHISEIDLHRWRWRPKLFSESIWTRTSRGAFHAQTLYSLSLSLFLCILRDYLESICVLSLAEIHLAS